MKICLDAGHGGHDPGAVGPAGLKESEVNLSICELMAAVLERYLVETKLTRTCEVFVGLSARCDIANDWCADYFISIHCNSNGPSAHGVETLYVTEEGESLAQSIQVKLVEATGDTDRGVKFRSDLAVLNGTDMGAVVAEIGFISCPDTERLLREKPYRKTIADAVVAGLSEHLKLKPS